MTLSSPVLRVATSVSAAVLAITVSFFSGGPVAVAAEPTPASTTSLAECLLLFCVPKPAGEPEPGGPTRTQEPGQPEGPTDPPADPVPAPPEQAAPPAAPPAATAPALAAPSAGPEETAGSQTPPTTAAGAAGSPPPTGASGRQDWNTPATKSAKATGAPALAAVGDSGPGGPALLPIIAGVLLLGVAGASFTWWGRNRFRVGAH
ncbi:MAG: hypothetical protein ABWY04_16860 [Arthrobacter sp.]